MSFYQKKNCWTSEYKRRNDVFMFRPNDFFKRYFPESIFRAKKQKLEDNFLDWRDIWRELVQENSLGFCCPHRAATYFWLGISTWKLTVWMFALSAVSRPLLVAHYNAKWNVGPLYSFVSVKKLYNVSLWTHTVKVNWDKLVIIIEFSSTHIRESATSWFHTAFIVLMYRAKVESWESSLL